MTDLALQDLTLRHHGQVIARLNLTVPAGQVLTLMGPCVSPLVRKAATAIA